jgi:hypothetical protein
VITRKVAQESKIKTRAMAKGGERKISLVEAKRNSRQRMVKGAAESVKDIYGNVSEYFSARSKFFSNTSLNLSRPSAQ